MIVVFGSINMDLIFNPPHAPQAGETVLLKNYDMLPGGKGANQAVAASRMGGTVMMVGCVGKDGFGTQLLNYIGTENVDMTMVSTTEKAQTGSAIITVEANGENRIMVAAGANLEVKAAQIEDDLLNTSNTILMQMETDPVQIKALALRAKGRARRVILNLAPALPLDHETLDHLDMLILNEIEIGQLAGYLNMSFQDNFRQAAQVIATSHNLICVVTQGSEGAEAFMPGGRDGIVAKALPLTRVIDTTGAGDAFCGTLAAGLDKGLDLAVAMQYACVAGSLACLKKGAMASYVPLAEIECAVRSI